jgi:hypothetical protein
LNQMVNNALVLPAIIDGQDAVGSVVLADQLLITSSGVLKRATVSQLASGLELNQFLRTDGTAVMQAGAQLTLGSSAPVGDLDAVSKGNLSGRLAGYLVNTVPSGYYAPFNGVLGIYGGGLVLFAGNPLVLGQDPVQAMEAATKQYVDASSTIKARASFDGTDASNPPIQGTATRQGSTNTITVTSLSAHGFKAGHRLYIEKVAASNNITSGVYVVGPNPTTYTFTVSSTETTPVTANTVRWRVAKFNSPSINVSSITCGGATFGEGYYFINFTNSFADTNYIPVWSPSSILNESNPTAYGRAQIAFWDEFVGSKNYLRSINSIAVTGYYGGGNEAGTRSGIVVF